MDKCLKQAEKEADRDRAHGLDKYLLSVLCDTFANLRVEKGRSAVQSVPKVSNLDHKLGEFSQILTESGILIFSLLRSEAVLQWRSAVQASGNLYPRVLEES